MAKEGITFPDLTFYFKISPSSLESNTYSLGKNHGMKKCAIFKFCIISFSHFKNNLFKKTSETLLKNRS